MLFGGILKVIIVDKHRIKTGYDVSFYTCIEKKMLKKNQNFVLSMGLYKGLGDVIAASIPAVYSKNTRIILFTINEPEEILSDTLNADIEFVSLGKMGRINFLTILKFARELLKNKPNIHVISNFSLSIFSISKLIQLILCKFLFIKVAGSSNDRLSFLYDIKISDDGMYQLIDRDYHAVNQIIPLSEKENIVQNLFRPEVFHEHIKTYKYIFHIGASMKHKRFSDEKLKNLLMHLSDLDICIIGTQNDFKSIESYIVDLNIDYKATTFSEMTSLINGCSVFIGFDSVAANISNLLNKKTHLISGPAASEKMFHTPGIISIHRSDFGCQSCMSSNCKFGLAGCMDAFVEEELVRRITA